MTDLSGLITTECAECLSWDICHENIEMNCPDSLLFVPAVPILLSQLYFAYTKSYINQQTHIYPPEFICFHDTFCSMFSIDNTTIRLNNLTCHKSEIFELGSHQFSNQFSIDQYLQLIHSRLWPCSSISNDYYTYCDEYHLFQCINTSKCISKYRLLDGINDCFYGDDEQIDVVSRFVQLDQDIHFFKCASSNMYISSRLVENDICDCPKNEDQMCDDEDSNIRYFKTHLSFQTVCDGFTELTPVIIDEQEMTDETNCDQWPCNNIYTRCDMIWNCYDGSDEMNCNYQIIHNCSSYNRVCVSPTTNNLTCIPVDKLNDGHVDCLGATDEVRVCRVSDWYSKRDRFYCRNDTINPCLDNHRLCDGKDDCLYGDDEQFCQRLIVASSLNSLCYYIRFFSATDVDKYFCVNEFLVATNPR